MCIRDSATVILYLIAVATDSVGYKFATSEEVTVARWRSGAVVARWSRSTKLTYVSRLVLGWVTVSGFNSRCGTLISVFNQPPRSTQPGHPFVSRCNEYQAKGGDALQLASNGRYGLCVGGR